MLENPCSLCVELFAGHPAVFSIQHCRRCSVFPGGSPGFSEALLTVGGWIVGKSQSRPKARRSIGAAVRR